MSHLLVSYTCLFSSNTETGRKDLGLSVFLWRHQPIFLMPPISKWVRVKQIQTMFPTSQASAVEMKADEYQIAFSSTSRPCIVTETGHVCTKSHCDHHMMCHCHCILFIVKFKDVFLSLKPSNSESTNCSSKKES